MSDKTTRNKFVPMRMSMAEIEEANRVTKAKGFANRADMTRFGQWLVGYLPQDEVDRLRALYSMQTADFGAVVAPPVFVPFEPIAEPAEVA